MLTVSSIAELRPLVKKWRLEGQRIAFVPTMGNLHAGHLKLVEEASKAAERVIVSIFVNPSQFGPGEDFASYPRTEADDAKALASCSVDVLFLPRPEAMYAKDHATSITIENLSTLHCGRSRPGHFDGVATVVAKLFNIVQSDIAFFGEKDFQQLTIIRRLVRDLNFDIEIKSVATVREPDGLAMSSRNNYLSVEQRKCASELYKLLCNARDKAQQPESQLAEIQREAMAILASLGFEPEYVSFCRSHDLEPASEQDSELVLLAAAKLGKTRLIDNLRFSRYARH
ncbi:MAG: pantoate--beta-alanine ligase [Methylicorpusculum sp.]|uniref:pantoate--beta-alanine ligase n=1 Tax=Methylicorpusculum sp. TaxID=2713644 RepID=UPI0027284596|nr:pantoate--beta-alanine ligase [Methylicorpusculum sp.]MDO8939619.1 pantoate--beta-alanine ligase [Methylicorpusculum sp.]MDO9238713.1 pantoate--beta-alanine ligase [Methylicorpusculum sp.]MDP2203667.1 pantoate--beta-alanine ligase [Methylicorpusculum sp.]